MSLKKTTLTGDVFTRAILLLGAAALCLPLPSPAEDGEESVRLYRTREEQREAGLQRQLTPWLTVSGLVEFERVKDRFSFTDGSDSSETDRSMSTQLAFVATPHEALKSELILEHDTDTDEVKADEFIVALELGDFELTLGKQYLAFGEYFDRFVSGPVLEFGETRDTAVTLSYDFDDRYDLSLSVYEGPARERDTNDDGNDWAAALEAWPTESLSFGLSYLSDLADSDERLLADEGDRFSRKVPAASGYLLWVADDYEVTLEALTATRSFREFDADNNRPRAWNLEVALFLHPKFDLALRVEGSRELADEPRSRYGVAMTYLLHRQATLTVEYLYGRFEKNNGDDEDPILDHINRFGGQLSVAF